MSPCGVARGIARPSGGIAVLDDLSALPVEVLIDDLPGSLALPATAAAPAAARALIARACQDWPARARNVAVLLTSELVTNAVLHGRPPLTLSLQLRHFSVRVAVADGSPVLPRLREPVAADEKGRGLFLVATLAADWGIAPADDGGKAVWFLLQRPVG